MRTPGVNQLTLATQRTRDFAAISTPVQRPSRHRSGGFVEAETPASSTRSEMIAPQADMRRPRRGERRGECQRRGDLRSSAE